MANPSAPVACTLTSDQLRCQANELFPGLASLAQSIEWSDAGVRFRFVPTAAHLTAITGTIERERHCCAFLTFQLTVPESQGSLILELSGPPGTRDFLDGLGLQCSGGTPALIVEAAPEP